MKDYLLIIVLLAACIIVVPFMGISIFAKILAEAGSIFCLFLVFTAIAEKKKKEEDKK